MLVPPGSLVSPETLEVVDGLVFSGGSDLDPDLYSADAHPETGGVIRERDDFELELMRAALERDVPMLAICRGSQVLNVALGGDIEQHVPDRVGTELHREVPGVFSEHDVSVVDGTRLASILGDRHDVKSHHHQGFGALGAGLGSGAGTRRNAGSAGGPDAPLHPGRPVASRSGRGPRAVRSPGRRGRGVPGLVWSPNDVTGV